MLVTEREQLRAIADDLRTRIIALIRDRAHSIQELSQVLELPKGTVGHHVKVLEQAGLIHVVRTRQVRAVTEKFYGRTARLFLFEVEDAEDLRAIGASALRQASYELELASDRASWGFVRSRLTSADAKRFERRLNRLIEDFRAAESPEGAAHALVSGFWPAEPSDA
jgi:DNA-binding transcriptional ArsR family regulator